MMLKLFVLYFLGIISTAGLFAQNGNKSEIEIEFSPIFNTEKSNIENKDIKNINLEICKFYVGFFTLYSNDKIKYIDSTYHLLDFKAIASAKVLLPIPNDLDYDQILFNIGVDSITNVSGAFEGDLDPINGMYWAWNTGYINSKIEGTVFATNNESINFKFHLGGYQAPFQTVRTISFPIAKNDQIDIYIDIPSFLEKISIKENSTIMSPSEKAVLVSTHFAQSFILDEK